MSETLTLELAKIEEQLREALPVCKPFSLTTIKTANGSSSASCARKQIRSTVKEKTAKSSIKKKNQNLTHRWVERLSLLYLQWTKLPTYPSLNSPRAKVSSRARYAPYMNRTFCFSPCAKYSKDLCVQYICVLQKQSKSPYFACQKPRNNYESNWVKTVAEMAPKPLA